MTLETLSHMVAQKFHKVRPHLLTYISEKPKSICIISVKRKTKAIKLAYLSVCLSVYFIYLLLFIYCLFIYFFIYFGEWKTIIQINRHFLKK